VLEVHFPMSFWSSRVVDDRPAYNSTMAFMYGPLVLAGVSNSTFFQPAGGKALEPATFIVRKSSQELLFEATGATYSQPEGGVKMLMMPLYQIMEESYSVYFKTVGISEVKYSASGAAVPTSSVGGDWSCVNAAAGVSKIPGDVDLRTKGPNTKSFMTVVHPIVGQGHSINSISMSYRYLAGFGNAGPGDWPVLSLHVVSAMSGKTVKTVYTSPPLDKYQFDRGDKYSPAINVSAVNLNIDNTETVFLKLWVANNARNLQIPLDPVNGLNMKVTWAPKEEGYTHMQSHPNLISNSNNNNNNNNKQEHHLRTEEEL